MVDRVRCVALKLHPGQRFAKDAPMDERLLPARAGREIAEAALQTDNLPQPFNVTAREW
jgi:hypothetical protein